MFNLLPPELVRQIIESSVPLTYHGETYVDRQSLLRSLCLVCKLFRDIAQPILREIVSLSGTKVKARLSGLLVSNDSAKNIREVRMWSLDRQTNSNVLLEKLITTCPNLEMLDLNVFGAQEGLKLQTISGLKKLRTLRLFAYSLQLDSLSFPSLRSLAITASHSAETTQQLLNSSHFPSLRALAFRPSSASSLLDIYTHPPCASLFDRLDAFFIPDQALSPTLIRHQPLLEKMLVHFSPSLPEWWHELAFRVHHASIRHYSLRHFTKTLREVDDCALRSVHLARPNQDDLTSNPTLASNYGTLLIACRERKIEVILEAQEEDSDGYPFVSHEFWRRQRVLRGSG
ncbi:hypothetical protein JCM5353_003392 [Sporobolomyces roseus]